MAQKPSEQELENWFIDIGYVVDVANGRVGAVGLKILVEDFRQWQRLPLDDAVINADVAVRPTRRALLKAKFTIWSATC